MAKLYIKNHHEHILTSEIGEKRALYLLLQYIEEHKEPGSYIEIYGDAQQVLKEAEAEKYWFSLYIPLHFYPFFELPKGIKR